MDPDAPDPTREGDAEALFAEFLELERAARPASWREKL